MVSEKNKNIYTEDHSNIRAEHMLPSVPQVKSNGEWLDIYEAGEFNMHGASNVVTDQKLSIESIYKVSHRLILESADCTIPYNHRFPERSQYSRLKPSGSSGIIITEDGLIITIEVSDVAINTIDIETNISTINLSAEATRGTHPLSHVDINSEIIAIMNGEMSFITDNIEEVDGYYDNLKGRISNAMLQDNKYYQQYSYEIASAENVAKYEQTITELAHPSGFLMTGKTIVDLQENIYKDFDFNAVAQFDKEVYTSAGIKSDNEWVNMSTPDATAWKHTDTWDQVSVNRKAGVMADWNILTAEEGFGIKLEDDDICLSSVLVKCVVDVLI
jgi:hypothetical protein